MAKKGKKFPIFVITLIIGLGMIGFAYYEADFSVGAVTDFGALTGFSFIDVPIDPTTGGILGTIVLGAPDVVPFEQAGTMIGIPRSSGLFPRSPCSDNLTGGNMFPYLPPDFGQRLSGERNQIDPTWWGSRDTGVTGARDCGFAYAQFDIVDIPNDFVATSVSLKLEILETRGIRNTNNPSQQCLITLQDFNIDTIADAGVIDKLYEGLTIASGTWCNSLGVRTFQLSQPAVDLINDAISGGAFSQGVRSDKILLGFVPKLFDNLGTGKNQLSTNYWKTEGSLFLTGSSPPISCDTGLEQVGFKCEPIICPTGESIDESTNTCEPIQCPVGEVLLTEEDVPACIAVCVDDPSTPEIECLSPCPPVQVGICTPIQCNIGEELVGSTCQAIQCPSDEHLVGTGCEPLICDEGFEAVNNQCTLKTCSTGMELVGDSCQAIVCPVNTILQGSDCVELQCSSSETIYNNECRDTSELCEAGILTCDPIIPPIAECPAGYNQVGANCVIAPESCPIGTEPHENVCVQILPDLLQVGGVEPSLLLLTGVIITGASGIGIVARRRS